MKAIKKLLFLISIILVSNLPMFGQTDSWKNAYSDIEINFSSYDVTIGAAGGYKFNRFAGVGLKFEKSIESDNLNILSLNFRGTNFKPGDRWGFYYTASVGKSFGDYKVDHFELVIGARYERFGLGFGFYNDGVNFKISQLLGDFKGRGTLLGKAFSPTPKTQGDKSKDHSSSGNFIRKKSNYFHFLIGSGSTSDHNVYKDFNRGTIHFNIGGGVQKSNYLGYGIALRGGSSLNPNGDNINFLAIGANFNGYPNIFFYNLTIGLVLNYSIIDDGEFPGLIFKIGKGFPLLFEAKGGIRLFRRFSVGMGFFASTKIKGNFQEYDDPIGNNILVTDEIRRSNFSGIQLFIGLAI